MGSKSSPTSVRQGADLLAWYDGARRDLPWRAGPGERPDSYRVWLSEIMLQQTTVATVVPYFGDFVARWPTITDLAAADLDDVLHAWQGLGYYARARNLWKCARTVRDECEGKFPDTEEGLRMLPGVGPYTAAAIAAIAFDRPTVAVDGNVERVVARLHALPAPVKTRKKQVGELARTLLVEDRPGDFVQALMELGATVCRPRNPECPVCPLARSCRARKTGRPEDFPVKAPKKARPTRFGVAYWLVREDGAVLLRRRPEDGLLGGMIEVPSSAWRERNWPTDEALAAAPAAADWRPLAGEVTHTFTHFHLRLSVVTAEAAGASLPDGVWCVPEEFANQPLPTVMKKVIRHAQRFTGTPESPL